MKLLPLYLVSICAITSGCVSYRFVQVPSFRSASIEHRGASRDEMSVPLTQGQDSKLYIDILVNDHPFHAAIDTGTFPTFFDKSALEDIGVKLERSEPLSTSIAGRGAVFEGALRSLKIGDMMLTDVTCWSVDLSADRKKQAEWGLRDFGVLIGGDFLSHFSAKIDYENKRLVLKLPNQASQPTPTNRP